MNTTEFQKILTFLEEIGIETESRMLSTEDCFLPGLLIEKGRIVYDTEMLQFPGDILHEAGHIAVVPRSERAGLDGKIIGGRKDAAAEEMMAISWSYAACLHLDIDPTYVFHESGYKGGGQSIIDNFKAGHYFAVPMLQWVGMTSVSSDKGPSYPEMGKWMRD